MPAYLADFPRRALARHPAGGKIHLGQLPHGGCRAGQFAQRRRKLVLHVLAVTLAQRLGRRAQFDRRRRRRFTRTDCVALRQLLVCLAGQRMTFRQMLQRLGLDGFVVDQRADAFLDLRLPLLRRTADVIGVIRFGSGHGDVAGLGRFDELPGELGLFLRQFRGLHRRRLRTALEFDLLVFSEWVGGFGLEGVGAQGNGLLQVAFHLREIAQRLALRGDGGLIVPGLNLLRRRLDERTRFLYQRQDFRRVIVGGHQLQHFVRLVGQLPLLARHARVFADPGLGVMPDLGLGEREVFLHQPQLRGLERGDVVEAFAGFVAALADKRVFAQRLDLDELHGGSRARQHATLAALRVEVIRNDIKRLHLELVEQQGGLDRVIARSLQLGQAQWLREALDPIDLRFERHLAQPTGRACLRLQRHFLDRSGLGLGIGRLPFEARFGAGFGLLLLPRLGSTLRAGRLVLFHYRRPADERRYMRRHQEQDRGAQDRYPVVSR